MVDETLSRRDFHKAGAASLTGAVSVAASGASLRAAAPSNQKRLGFIGVGNHEVWGDPKIEGALSAVPYLRKLGVTPENLIYKFDFRDMEMGYYTGLEVSHEPGQWLVWGGVLLMGLGLFVAFYLVHMRVWIAAVTNPQGNLVLWIGGQANKNRDRFEEKFNDLVGNIRTELEGANAIPPLAKKEKPELTLAGAK